MNMFDTWQKRLKDVANPNDVEEILPGDETGSIFHLDNQELNRDLTSFPYVEDAAVSTLPPLPEVDASLRLNEKQMMVHDIVCSHLRASLSGACPPQRLMIVHGQGGTGKTALLNAIANTFMSRYCRNVRPTWVKFDSKNTKESWVGFEVLSTKSKKRT